jgi:hypothetical protein
LQTRFLFNLSEERGKHLISTDRQTDILRRGRRRKRRKNMASTITGPANFGSSRVPYPYLI